MGFKDWYYPETLEPKWQGHFGNYIDNTLLALHKFQAKKQVFPNRIENGTTQRQQQSSPPFAMLLACAAVCVRCQSHRSSKFSSCPGTKMSQKPVVVSHRISTQTGGRVTPPPHTEGWNPTGGPRPHQRCHRPLWWFRGYLLGLFVDHLGCGDLIFV